MGDLVVVTALRLERFALRRGLGNVPVIAVGMGVRHQSRLSLPPGACVVVAGVGVEVGDERALVELLRAVEEGLVHGARE